MNSVHYIEKELIKLGLDMKEIFRVLYFSYIINI